MCLLPAELHAASKQTSGDSPQQNLGSDATRKGPDSKHRPDPSPSEQRSLHTPPLSPATLQKHLDVIRAPAKHSGPAQGLRQALRELQGAQLSPPSYSIMFPKISIGMNTSSAGQMSNVSTRSIVRK